MTGITRRRVMTGAGAAAVVGTIPLTVSPLTPLATKAPEIQMALAGEETQVLALFRLLGDRERASVHFWARVYAGLPDDKQIRRRFTGEFKS